MSTHIPGLFILKTDEKGRGVYTSIPIGVKDTIESAPVVVLSESERKVIHDTRLHDYYFLWGQAQNGAAIALGYGSLYNHSSTPNADFILDYDHDTIDFVAIKPIEAGDEITINYSSEKMEAFPLWFEPKN